MTIENIEKERMIKVMTKKALDLAIKVLEQQPCEDCISRKAVNTLIDELARAISDERCFVSKGVVPRGRETSLIMRDILDLPSVTPKAEWIPVSERLPEENITVIGTTKIDDIYKTELYDDCGEKKWYANGNFDVPIIAWMPLPEPYKAESEV
jgi:hypothetical protein